MKNILKYIFATAVLSVSLTSCRDSYLDSIKPVAQGTDTAAPTILINSPSSDIALPAIMNTKDMTFSYKISDDIELGSVKIYLDGTLLKSYDSFLDYRILDTNYLYKGLSLGTHVFKVDAADLSGKSSSKSFTFNVTKYTQVLSSESLYVPFNSGNDFKDLINFADATITGAPSTTIGKKGVAYQGATDAYISYPIAGLFGNNNTELSFSFWYKIDASQERAGLVVVGKDQNRAQGFRLFREGTKGFKINIGLGGDEFWGDTVPMTNIDWTFVTVTISQTNVKFYYDGVLKYTGNLPKPVDFTGCSMMDIASGGSTFSYWDHKSDKSLYDEFRVYNKELTPTEIQTVMNK